MITLTNRHLIISNEIVESIFGFSSQVNWVYYDVKKILMIASQHDDIFKGLHKTSMSMLKFKNSKGDRSISLEEMLIDNELDSSDRSLEFNADEKMKILTVHFS
ncbi:MAG: hypothetical protein HYI21_08480 [Sediminibacterium sp. Gen4]|uniref:hypothetical protein n=1 Tax=unclassified Sediminibacterium TaxID=2635961 RepID=UPI0015B98EBC|nr:MULTISPECIES: hypothetical protein [unclassified Sediminibacterium]MBW0162424.1 hypothetical protein [Sediminibacterium sp.]MBW0164632.1 hypothetical protein [Sediminibacterium sp.]MDZ4070770.1 hypothetical protein [Sediminibacterium sp.]NWK66048.1 hypothetical protein [Sediminibacterium sp. Gen4]